MNKILNFLKIALFTFTIAATDNINAAPVVWVGGSGTSLADLNTAANWVGNAVPSGGTAQFDNTAANFGPTLNVVPPVAPVDSLSLAEIIMIPNVTYPYMFMTNTGNLTLTGAGISNQNPAITSTTFNFIETSTLTFAPNAASTITVPGQINYNFNKSSLVFQGNSNGQASAVGLAVNSSIKLTGTNSQVSLGLINGDINSTIQLGTGNTLTLGTLGNSTINSPISDMVGAAPSGLVITGSNTTTLAGANSYRGGTVLNSGALVVGADNNLGDPSGKLTISGGVVGFTPFTNQSPGFSSYRDISIGDGVAALLYVDNNFSASLNGPISGAGASGLVKGGPGTLVLNGNNSYVGITVISDGTLMTKAESLPTAVVNNSNLTFVQNKSATYAGIITGAGTNTITGNGTLTLNGNSIGFTGNTIIQNGKLSLQNNLGGNAIVNSGGVISGTGTVGGTLSIGLGGTVSPGNSIGTLVVNGNYIQADGSTYKVEFDQTGSSSLIDVTGVALLNGGTVETSSVDGKYDITKTLVILDADGGVNGTFTNAVAKTLPSQFALYTPVLSYDANHAYVTLQQTIMNAAKTYNQRQVARNLDAIENPTPAQAEILNALIGLSNNQARHSLNQMSGQQHAADLILTELNNRQFIRRLFDPLRSIVGKNPRIIECYEIEEECECCPCGVDLWMTGSGSRTTQKGGQNAIGFKMDGGEITIGAQKRLADSITLGVAGSYEFDHILYRVGGSGRMNSFFGGIYGLYRPSCFYFLSDITFGYSANKMERPIEIGELRFSARSTPKISQVTTYAEFGVDFAWEDLLIQPFIGVEVGSYWRRSVKEHGADDFNLTVKQRKRICANTRFGVHLNAPNLPSDFDLSLDLAWICRWSSRGNVVNQHFATFGTEMCIEGMPLYHNNFEGTVAITKELCDNWSLFAEFSGEFWRSSVSYYILGGFERRW